MHPLRQPSYGSKQNEKEANQHRSKCSFEVGDQLFMKLQPYK